MQTVNLYRYEDADSITITPEKRNPTDPIYCYRLIADDGKILTDGEMETPCIDTHDPWKWSEIDDPNPKFYLQEEPQ